MKTYDFSHLSRSSSKHYLWFSMFGMCVTVCDVYKSVPNEISGAPVCEAQPIKKQQR